MHLHPGALSDQHWIRCRLVSQLAPFIDIRAQANQNRSNAIISLNLVSLMITYQISIACILYRRVCHPELLPKCRWSLGKYGVAINACGLAYSSFCFFWCFWPNTTPVTADEFNWAVVMFIAVMLICAVAWVVRARHVYKGPVVLVEGWRGD